MAVNKKKLWCRLGIHEWRMVAVRKGIGTQRCRYCDKEREVK